MVFLHDNDECVMKTFWKRFGECFRPSTGRPQAIALVDSGVLEYILVQSIVVRQFSVSSPLWTQWALCDFDSVGRLLGHVASEQFRPVGIGHSEIGIKIVGLDFSKVDAPRGSRGRGTGQRETTVLVPAYSFTLAAIAKVGFAHTDYCAKKSEAALSRQRPPSSGGLECAKTLHSYGGTTDCNACGFRAE